MAQLFRLVKYDNLPRMIIWDHGRPQKSYHWGNSQLSKECNILRMTILGETLPKCSVKQMIKYFSQVHFEIFPTKSIKTYGISTFPGLITGRYVGMTGQISISKENQASYQPSCTTRPWDQHRDSGQTIDCRIASKQDQQIKSWVLGFGWD